MTARCSAAEWEPRYAARAERMRASEIRELLKLLDRPGIISFAGGIPDPALFPVARRRAAYAAVLGDAAGAGSGLQYSVSEGYLPLRQWIVRHMGGSAWPARRTTSSSPPARSRGSSSWAGCCSRPATPRW